MTMKMESTLYDIGPAIVSDAHSGEARADENCSEDEDQSAYEALQHLPPDERRKALRRLRNRESARRVRARRLAEMSSMEATLKTLQKENEALKQHVSKLQIHTQTVTMKVYEVTAKYEAAVAENAQLRAELQRARRRSLTGDSSFTMPSASAAPAAPTAIRHNSTNMPTMSPFIASCAADEGSAQATPGHMQLRSSSPMELQQQRQAMEEVVMLLQVHKRRRQQAVQDGSGGSDNASSVVQPVGLNAAASAATANMNVPNYGVDMGTENRIPSVHSGYSPMAPGPAPLYPNTLPAGIAVAAGPGAFKADDFATPVHHHHHLQGQMQPPQQPQPQQQLAHALSVGRMSASCPRRMSCDDTSSPLLPPLPPPLPQLPPATQLQPQHSLLTASHVAHATHAASALAAGPCGSLEVPLSQQPHHPQQPMLMQSHSQSITMPQTWQAMSAAHALYGFPPCQHDPCQQQQGLNATTTAPYKTVTALSAPGPLFTAAYGTGASPNGMAPQGLCPAVSEGAMGILPGVGPDSAVDRVKAEVHNGMMGGIMAPGWASGWAGGNVGTNNGGGGVGGGGGGGLEIPDDVYMSLDDFMPQDL